jgi:hypothetical protein
MEIRRIYVCKDVLEGKMIRKILERQLKSSTEKLKVQSCGICLEWKGNLVE